MEDPVVVVVELPEKGRGQGVLDFGGGAGAATAVVVVMDGETPADSRIHDRMDGGVLFLRIVIQSDLGTSRNRRKGLWVVSRSPGLLRGD